MGSFDPAGDDRFAGKAGEIWLREDGIIHVKFASDIDLEKQDAETAIERIEALGGDGSVVLIDRTNPHSISFEAQQYFAQANREGKVRVAAYLVRSNIGAGVAQAAQYSYMRDIKVQVFVDEAEALTWLRQFLPDPSDA